jgi:hypothetical protein
LKLYNFNIFDIIEKQNMQQNLKILLGTAIGFFVLGAIFIIVSTATLSSDNELSCLFFTGPCIGYVIPQDSDFCCASFDYMCYAKFYCNGDTFTVNGLRYMGIAAFVIGIVVAIVFCQKKRAAPNNGNNGNYQQFQN